MNTANAQPKKFISIFQKFTASSWYVLRSAKTTGVLLGILTVIFLLALTIPQQPLPNTPAAIWIGSLPVPVQPWGNLFYFLGFSNILNSLWFWGVLALLVVNSLIALADYTSPSWRRAKKDAANIEWQHPLANRVEYSVRLPALPDEFLDRLKKALVGNGFSIDPLPNTDTDQRNVSATRWRWVWFGVIGFYAGVLVLVLAFLTTYVTLKTEQFTVWPFHPKRSQLFDSTVELYQVNGASATVIFDPVDPELPALAFFLRPWQPVFFKQALIWATTIEPILTVEAKDISGDQRRIMPLQVDLSPDVRLNLPLPETEDPLYFLIPSADLAFQIAPVSADNLDTKYNVQVRRGSEDTPSENLIMSVGEPFEIDDLSISLSLNHNISLIARRDFGLLLYLLSVTVMIVCGVLLLFLPPQQVWLIPDVKGRGGQLYGVLEKFALTKDKSQFLEQLLNPSPETAETDPETKLTGSL